MEKTLLDWIDVISSDDSRWDSIITQTVHDIHHTAAYHQVSGIGSEGKNVLFACGSRNDIFCWPYILRSLDDVPGCENTGYNDITSIYGYSGPVTSRGASPSFISHSLKALEEHWMSQRVISAFTRFNPLISNHNIIGQCTDDSIINGSGLRQAGSTISIDLTMSPDDQLRQYQKVLRQDIRKSKERGMTVHHDDSWKVSQKFVQYYRSTMMRRDAAVEYFIDDQWLEEFRFTLKDSCHLFSVEFDGDVAASLLALEYQGIVHAHLTGINNNLLHLSPLKFLLDGIRIWCNEKNYTSFHLGGGIGGKEDSLFSFKRKFSSNTHSFITGRWIIDIDAYTDANQRSNSFDTANNDGYFPAYRHPKPEAINYQIEKEIVEEITV